MLFKSRNIKRKIKSVHVNVRIGSYTINPPAQLAPRNISSRRTMYPCQASSRTVQRTWWCDWFQTQNSPEKSWRTCKLWASWYLQFLLIQIYAMYRSRAYSHSVEQANPNVWVQIDEGVRTKRVSNPWTCSIESIESIHTAATTYPWHQEWATKSRLSYAVSWFVIVSIRIPVSTGTCAGRLVSSSGAVEKSPVLSEVFLFGPL